MKRQVIVLAEPRTREEDMKWANLITMNFEKNVGTADRVFRIVSGLVVACAGWGFALPMWQSIALSVLGLMWTASGALSRCSIYYLLGYSTCPISGQSSNVRRAT
jgi:hypothetical protein